MTEDPKKKAGETTPPPAGQTPEPPATNGQVVPPEPQRDGNGNGIKKFINRHRKTLDGLSQK